MCGLSVWSLLHAWISRENLTAARAGEHSRQVRGWRCIRNSNRQHIWGGGWGGGGMKKEI